MKEIRELLKKANIKIGEIETKMDNIIENPNFHTIKELNDEFNELYSERLKLMALVDKLESTEEFILTIKEEL